MHLLTFLLGRSPIAWLFDQVVSQRERERESLRGLTDSILLTDTLTADFAQRSHCVSHLFAFVDQVGFGVLLKQGRNSGVSTRCSAAMANMNDVRVQTPWLGGWVLDLLLWAVGG